MSFRAKNGTSIERTCDRDSAAADLAVVDTASRTSRYTCACPFGRYITCVRALAYLAVVGSCYATCCSVASGNITTVRASQNCSIGHSDDSPYTIAGTLNGGSIDAVLYRAFFTVAACDTADILGSPIDSTCVRAIADNTLSFVPAHDASTIATVTLDSTMIDAVLYRPTIIFAHNTRCIA